MFYFRFVTIFVSFIPFSVRLAGGTPFRRSQLNLDYTIALLFNLLLKMVADKREGK